MSKKWVENFFAWGAIILGVIVILAVLIAIVVYRYKKIMFFLSS